MFKTLLHALNLDNWEPDDDDMEPGTPGLYVLLDKCGYPVYIGHSSNLPRRLAQHIHEGVKTFHSIKLLHTLPCLSSESFRLRLEGMLILYYTPKYNKGLNLGLSSEKVWEIRWNQKSRSPKSGKSSGRRART